MSIIDSDNLRNAAREQAVKDWQAQVTAAGETPVREFDGADHITLVDAETGALHTVRVSDVVSLTV